MKNTQPEPDAYNDTCWFLVYDRGHVPVLAFTVDAPTTKTDVMNAANAAMMRAGIPITELFVDAFSDAARDAVIVMAATGGDQR